MVSKGEEQLIEPVQQEDSPLAGRCDPRKAEDSNAVTDGGASSCSVSAEDAHGIINTKNSSDAGASPEPGKKRSLQSGHREGPPKKLKTATAGPLDKFFRPISTEARTEQPRAEDGNDKDDEDDDDDDDDGDNEDGESGSTEMEIGKIVKGSHDQLIVGQSHSQQNIRKLRAALLDGSFVPNPRRVATLTRRIRQFDRNAEVNALEWLVKCSKCNTIIKLGSAYSAKKFVKHARSCRGDPTLDKYTVPRNSGQLEENTACAGYAYTPCSGLSEADDSRIGTYLSRPTALGGGGRSKSKLALERFGSDYGDLSNDKKREITLMNENGWLWRINHQHRVVFSVSCNKNVLTALARKEETTRRTCFACRSLLDDYAFNKAIDRPEPAPEHLKYVNKEFLHSELGIKFAKCRGALKLIDPKVRSLFFLISYCRY